MRQPRYKRPLLCLLALCILLTSLAGCGGKPKQDPADEPRTADEIFSKKITDFDPDRVISLDGSEDNNFLVYQEDVFALEADTVLAADPAAGVYTLSAGDPAAKALRKGDVFYVEPTAAQPDGITVKVAERKKQGDTVTITADPEMTLADLLEYACVDMALPASGLVWDETELPEGVTLKMTDAAEAAALFPTLENDPSIPGQLAPILPAEQQPASSQPGSGSQIGSSEADSLPSTAGGADGDRYYHSDPSGIGGQWDISGLIPVLAYDQQLSAVLGTADSLAFNYTFSGLMAITDVHILFKFSLEELYLTSGVWIDSLWYDETQGEIQYTGTVELFKFPPMHIPLALPGVILRVSLDLSLVYEQRGSLQGSRSTTYKFTTGGVLSLDSDGCHYTDMRQQTANTKADLSLQGAVGVGLKGRACVGWPMLADIYVDLGVFIEASSEDTLRQVYTSPYDDNYAELQADTPPYAIHDCDVCYSGEIGVVMRLGIGAEILNLELLFPGWGLRYEFLHLENRLLKINDFYASHDTKFHPDKFFEFGWGQCPYWRYRADVTVYDETGEPADAAQVTAQFADLRTDGGETDDQGGVILYLPPGDNLLNAHRLQQRGSTHAAVIDAPVSAVIRMEAGSGLYINYPANEQGNDNDSFPEVLSRLETMFPEATFVCADSPVQLVQDGVVMPGDVVLDVKYGAPEREYGEWKDEDLSDGDDSNIWGESGGWVYVEAHRVYQHENGWGTHRYFSFDITYDGPYKAWLASPKPISSEALRMTVNYDVSAVYEDDFTLAGIGVAGEGPTQMQTITYLPHPYSTDVNSIYAIPSQRNMIAEEIHRLQAPVEDMLDGADLQQQAPVF